MTEEETIRDTPVLTEAGRVEADEAPAPDAMRRYLLTLAAVMALIFVAPFFLARSAFYDRVDPSFYAKSLNYAYETAGQNADIVIFGDSTALLGIDPSRMTSALGVKVLNLPNTQATLIVNDDMSLSHYLNTNRPPKLILFYFAPWDFDYGHIDFNTLPTYEGEQLLLRRGTPQAIRAFGRKHPREILLFPLRFYGTFWQFTSHHTSVSTQEAQLIATRGHVDIVSPSILQAPCRFPQYLIDNVRFSWMHDLGERYRSPETQVLYYVAPVPACENVSELLARPYEQLPASPPKAVPLDFFINDVRFIHPRAFAVPELTQNLIDAVRPVLSSPR